MHNILVYLLEWNVVQQGVAELVTADSVMTFVAMVKHVEFIMPKHFLNASSEFHILIEAKFTLAIENSNAHSSICCQELLFISLKFIMLFTKLSFSSMSI